MFSRRPSAPATRQPRRRPPSEIPADTSASTPAGIPPLSAAYHKAAGANPCPTRRRRAMGKRPALQIADCGLSRLRRPAPRCSPGGDSVSARRALLGCAARPLAPAIRQPRRRLPLKIPADTSASTPRWNPALFRAYHKAVTPIPAQPDGGGRWGNGRQTEFSRPYHPGPGTSAMAGRYGRLVIQLISIWRRRHLRGHRRPLFSQAAATAPAIDSYPGHRCGAGGHKVAPAGWFAQDALC